MRVIRSVALIDRAGSFDLEIEGERVRALSPSASAAAPRWLAMPSLVNLHAHANRAYAASSQRPASLSDAVASAKRERANVSIEDVRARAARLFDRSIAHGVCSLRTHTDVDPVSGMVAVEGVLAAAAQVRTSLDVEVVAFASAAADPSQPETGALFAEAVERGASFIGAVPALSARPKAALEALLDTALALEVSLDIHLDEHLEASNALIHQLVDATLTRGLQNRVTVSHACVLSAMPRDEVRRLLDRMAEAGIVLVVLPELNLYLQSRGDGAPRLRGLAPVLEALKAGVAVRFGTDNVRDWFFPFGDGDMLETGFVGAMAAHVDAAQDLAALVCGGRRRIEPGDVADLLLIPASSFDDALARRPDGRVLLRRGRTIDAIAGASAPLSGHAGLVDAGD
ncbi:Cytosine deaminase [Variovorax sp. PBS-H4]|uniref:amidohydrolase family protein n=1 Tax=Variovorax sp. PBS-H4 TaxID=434008 RepID=UPI001316DBDD|nr:amidohydrolase family protein [Variovorax sp. PBS-H4]VTU39972.1 Cytosine deaminase [Variovorax sp. PBS-H4]